MAATIGAVAGGCSGAPPLRRALPSTAAVTTTATSAPAASTATRAGAPTAAPRTTPGTTAEAAPATTSAATVHPSAANAPMAAVSGRTIVLDPGHNGGNFSAPSVINQLVFIGNGYKACDTTGTATSDGYTEAAYNFDVATRLAGLLRAAGANVILTRPDNAGVGPCITQRAAVANLARAAVAISIHADGGPAGGRGFQVLEPAPIPGYDTAIVAPSDRLALDVRRDYQAATAMPFSTYVGTDGLQVRSDLGGLNLSTVPKVFIETGNMRNATDAAALESPSFRQRVAAGLAQAFADFLAGE